MADEVDYVVDYCMNRVNNGIDITAEDGQKEIVLLVAFSDVIRLSVTILCFSVRKKAYLSYFRVRK